MGRYPYGLADKHRAFLRQMRAPPGSDLTQLQLPLMLKDRVKMKGAGAAEVGACLTELNLMFQCWSLNDYDEKKCASESKAFFDCYEKSEKERFRQKEEASRGIISAAEHVGTRQKLSSKQINELLKRNPHPLPKAKAGVKFRR